LKDPSEVKVYALKNPGQNRNSKGQPIVKDRYNDAPPGTNTSTEVRAAQRNLLACGIAADMVGVIKQDDTLGAKPYRLDVEKYDPLIDDLMDMITPNTAYVTGPTQSWSGAPANIDHERRTKKDKLYEKLREDQL
jgi:hypothetical protein